MSEIPEGVSNHEEERDDVEDLLDELEELEESVEGHEAKSRVRESIRLARRINNEGTFGQVIKGFDRHDAAEALVGSVVFGIPMVIEGGTLEAGEFVATHPLYFFATIAFGISLVVGLLYVAEVQDVRVVDRCSACSRGASSACCSSRW